ncbi:TPA: hypothetical protein DDW35_07390 [Candidatus Sumerlaeota bacterium]|jgi:uncharacterized protein|nr:hypothetical protein [Candidatus Sumerlaeota bacterium]
MKKSTKTKRMLMWTIYDALLDLIPENLMVHDCQAGVNWTFARSLGVGLAMTPLEGERRLTRAGSIAGTPLRRLAEYIKSWNNLEAAVGLAAINSAINAPQEIQNAFDRCLDDFPKGNVFDCMLGELRGKKVGVVGHFQGLERVAAVCESLTILERRPLPGDLPDSACEYVLPDQDYVFITATTLINKTLPRLLALSEHAQVVLVGPSTPMTPLFFDFGIKVLAGMTVVNEIALCRSIQEGGDVHSFESGTRKIFAGYENAKTLDVNSRMADTYR